MQTARANRRRLNATICPLLRRTFSISLVGATLTITAVKWEEEKDYTMTIDVHARSLLLERAVIVEKKKKRMRINICRYLSSLVLKCLQC